MSYRIDPGTGGVGAPVSDGMMDEVLIAANIYGFLLGIGFFYWGTRRRLLWLRALGGILVISHVTYLGVIMLGVI